MKSWPNMFVRPIRHQACVNSYVRCSHVTPDNPCKRVPAHLTDNPLQLHLEPSKNGLLTGNHGGQLSRIPTSRLKTLPTVVVLSVCAPPTMFSVHAFSTLLALHTSLSFVNFHTSPPLFSFKVLTTLPAPLMLLFPPTVHC